MRGLAALGIGVWRPGIFPYRIRLVSLFGFDVWIDASWLLLAALIGWSLAEAIFPRIAPDLAPPTYWWMAAATTVGLLFSIVFHELAHSLVARHYGLPIRGITLFIFGGVAEMESEPKSPKSELLMAAAGPASSLVLAGVFFALVALVETSHGPEAVGATLWYLGLLNGMLALLNLVPAFPLDGGRMLRAVLWMWRDFAWATRIAAAAGNLFGIALIIYGVFGVVTGDFIGGMWRFLIGMFLRGAAAMSYQESLARTALEGVTVSQIMNRQPIAVPPDTSVADFIENFVYRYHHRSFPVASEGLLAGCIGTEQAATLDRAAWAQTPVAQIMISCSEMDIVKPGADALAALTRMRRKGGSRLWVVERGRLVGILSLRDMLELLSVKSELEGGRSAPPQARTGAAPFRDPRPPGDGGSPGGQISQ